MNIEPLNRTFGARITGLDLTQLGAGEFEALYKLWLQYALLIFPEQFLSRDTQVAFARQFGELEFDYAAISNLTRDGKLRDEDDVVKILKGNMDWHCDSTYMPVMAKGAVFSAHVVPPEGGETSWADMRAAYDALPADTRRTLEKLSAHHSLQHSQSKLGHSHSADSEYSGYGFHDGEVPLRGLVKQHAETDRKSLLIGRHAFDIPGKAAEDSKQLLQDLVNDACQGDRIYTHRWTPGEVVVWDNRCLLHRANPWDMSVPRVMYHSRIAGDPIYEGAS
tara:strand:- start:13 stop:846 length:834 start_codon:yes stop_codon:yes gene_type:complete